ncbi:MAG: efflux RND transporter permease subunit [Spirochaetaceae bacterium]|jgi:multidrug efflux pump subunit AcrB|nr:efflux RND transporter permease subunit [Spirochaetaceae bacterium]
MKGLIDLCVRRPVSVLMFLAALLLGGFFSFSTLPLQRLPEFPFPRVTVETLYPGLGAEDIRSCVTIPVEDALSSVKGLERMRSVSRDGASLTVLDFRWGVDGGAASVLVREAIDAVYPSLPEGASKPAVVPGDPDEAAQLIVAIRSPLGGAFARNLAGYEVRSLLRRVDGVGAILLSGGEREELAIKVDIPRSLSRGLPPAVLAEILSAETANIPAGNAREGDKELVVVSQGRPVTEAELGSIIFPSQNGSFVIGDIGFLNRTAAKKESLFIASINAPDKNDGSNGTVSVGEYAALEIFRRPGADPVKLSRDIRKAVEEASVSFGRDAEIRIVYDDAASVIPGLQKLFVSVIFGTAAVMAVLYLTLRSVRYSILAGLSLPLSMAASLVVLGALGRTLNNMSLSGIALGIGLVSDTSVIILDLLHQSFGKKENRVSLRLEAAKPSYTELGAKAASVAASSFGGTATTAVVFIPVVFLPGPLGSLFGDLSISLVVSILTGWLYAQFALPSLFGLFFFSKKSGSAKDRSFIAKIMQKQNDAEKHKTDAQRNKKTGDFLSANHYAPLLLNCLHKPFRVLGITVLFCAAGLALLLTRPMGFVSADAALEIEAVLNFPPGTTMESVAAQASVAGERLASLPNIISVFGRAGSEEEDTARRSDPDYRKETFCFRCILNPAYQSDVTLSSVNSLLENQPYEALARFPQDKTEKILGLSSSSTIAVKGRNRDEAERRAAEAENFIRQSGYAAAVTLHPAGSRPEIRVLPDREALAHAGLSAVEIARAFYAAAEGMEAGELELEGKPLTMKVSAMEMPELERLPVALSRSGPVFAGSVARIEHREAAAAMARLDRSDALYVEAAPHTGSEKTLAAFLTSLCAREKESGITRADESAFTRYRASLILTIVLVLILLYLTMGAEFESFILPLVLMLAIPFSLAGAGPALFFCGAFLDSSSVLAMMVLFGLSVNSGMVLYELAAEKTALGYHAKEAVYDAALERFRPVLTTALTTAVALLPLVISPLGAKEHSMAAAMLGGVTASTALTLFALPPVLIRFLQYRKRKAEAS